MPSTTSPRRRFTESIPGTIAAALLALLWIASMSAGDSNAYSMAPYVTGLAVVAAVWGIAVLMGYKMVKLRLLSWITMAAGAYFLVRCHYSYSVVEAWGEAGLILGCFVFYVAGVYAGQGDRCRWLMGTILAALAVNVAAFLLGGDGQHLAWGLRPEFGVCGRTVPNIAFFTYKNFAGFFLITAGMLPLCRMACRTGFRWRDALMVLAGLGAAYMASYAGTRAIWVLAPILLGFIWLLRLLVCLAENRRLGILLVLIGICIFVATSIGIYDFFFGHTLVDAIMGMDSHLRTMAWEIACKVAPAGGWCGFGACASQWEIVQYFNDWCTPNMLHNEYLQAWLDYGLVGVTLMGGILLLHFVAGMRQLTAEHVSSGQRAKAAMALLFLLATSLFAILDFGWHQPAIAGATAFACGLLASPYPARTFRWRELWRNWAPGSRPSVQPIRAQGPVSRLLLLAAGCALAFDMVKIGKSTTPAWMASWQYSAMVKQNAPVVQLLDLLEKTHADYPDSKIPDFYILHRIPLSKGTAPLETMLRRSLEANPRQVFTSIMLADLCGRDGRYEEAEKIFRQAYNGDGSSSCRTNSWVFFYAFNLIRWGQRKMYEGDLPTALSMLSHGFTLSHSHAGHLPDTTYRGGYKPWENKQAAKLRTSVFNAAKADLQMLRAMGTQPDDSWMQPMEPGGKPALYRRWKPSK